MKHEGRIELDRYTPIEYEQFSQSTAMRLAMMILGVLTWPLTVPLALLSRLSDLIFLFSSQLLALFPYVVGTIIRYEFYRFALTKCGRNVMIGYGTVFIYRDIEIGDNVLIGMYNTVHHCDFGSYVLTAEGCRFLSGARYHNFDDVDRPMALQGGSLKRIRLSDDVWVGANAVVMANLGRGCIVGAGAVVGDDVQEFSIVGGVPAKEIRKRKSDSAERNG